MKRFNEYKQSNKLYKQVFKMIVSLANSFNEIKMSIINQIHNVVLMIGSTVKRKSDNGKISLTHHA
jgi:hypothetical protein